MTFDQLSSEATTGPSAILFSSQSPTVVTESETSKSTTLLPTTDAILQTIATTAVVQGQAQSICHIYGDPHVIRFAAQPQDVQQQYWCRLAGQFQLFSNQFVRIDGRIRNGTWAIDQVSFKRISSSRSKFFSSLTSRCSTALRLCPVSSTAMNSNAVIKVREECDLCFHRSFDRC